MERIATEGLLFVDEFNRQRLFNGINLVHKGEKLPDGSTSYIGPWKKEHFAQFASWGFNVVRLGLIWDAVEPRPGVYDEAYLDWVGEMLDCCRANGIYAFLDMHQDLYSALFSDGAPAWATLTEHAFEPTELWSDAYLFSPAVQQAYDAFWENRKAPGGVGLQDHYARMWAHVARRFAGHEAVLGFDFLNEPAPGSACNDIFAWLLDGFAQIMGFEDGGLYTAEDMAQIFMDPERKLRGLSLLDNREYYKLLGQTALAPVREFEQNVLEPFYNKIAAAVRAVTGKGILLRENSYFSNMGIPCAARPIRPGDAREPLQAYCPHGYDLVSDTDTLALATASRIDTIFENHRETQQALGVPVLVGEWGAFMHNPDILGYAEHIMGVFEAWQWSSTYWAWDVRFENAPVLQALRRTVPQAVAGRIVRYGNNRAEKTFELIWEDDAGCGAPTVVYLHDTPESVVVEGDYAIDSNKLTIPALGGRRTLRIRY